MKKLLFALSTLSLNAFANPYADYVERALANRPDEKLKINKISVLAQDLNLHYDAAIISGTTKEYEFRANISLFQEMLDASDTQCSEDIDLNACLFDLLCKDQIQHSFDVRMFKANNCR